MLKKNQVLNEVYEFLLSPIKGYELLNYSMIEKYRNNEKSFEDLKIDFFISDLVIPPIIKRNVYDNLYFYNLDLSKLDLRNADFCYCLFENCNFSNSVLMGSNWLHSAIYNCNFNNTVLFDTNLPINHKKNINNYEDVPLFYDEEKNCSFQNASSITWRIDENKNVMITDIDIYSRLELK